MACSGDVDRQRRKVDESPKRVLTGIYDGACREMENRKKTQTDKANCNTHLEGTIIGIYNTDMYKSE